MKKLIIILIVHLISISKLFSQQAQTDGDLVKKNTFYFEIEAGVPKGMGYDILTKEIENTQFVILGEEHFSAKVSEFTNAIIPTLAKNEYKYFAAEIGPHSAKEMTSLIRQGQSLYDFNTRIYSLVGEVPVPFFDGKEDEVFLKSLIKNGFEIWGLDQEYLTSQVFLVDKLYALSAGAKDLKASYVRAKEFAILETKKSRVNRKYKAFSSLLNAPEINNYFEKLDTGKPEIKKIISDLKKSWRVYKLREDKDLYTSIHQRLRIMQDNFIDYYNTALQTKNLPKVFLKIGGVHASKGKSHHNIYDIGNFMMELAHYHKTKAVHILIFPSGYVNNDGTISSNIEKEDQALFDPIIDDARDKWVLIDLKSIEKWAWKNKIESESLKDYMYRFDYMILTPASKQTELNYKK